MIRNALELGTVWAQTGQAATGSPHPSKERSWNRQPQRVDSLAGGNSPEVMRRRILVRSSRWSIRAEEQERGHRASQQHWCIVGLSRPPGWFWIDWIFDRAGYFSLPKASQTNLARQELWPVSVAFRVRVRHLMSRWWTHGSGARRRKVLELAILAAHRGGSRMYERVYRCRPPSDYNAGRCRSS